jgi:hypothetical protein
MWDYEHSTLPDFKETLSTGISYQIMDGEKTIPKTQVVMSTPRKRPRVEAL